RLFKTQPAPDPEDWTSTSQGPVLDSAEAIVDALAGWMPPDPNRVDVVYLTSTLDLVAVEPHRVSALKNAHRWLVERARALGARRRAGRGGRRVGRPAGRAARGGRGRRPRPGAAGGAVRREPRHPAAPRGPPRAPPRPRPPPPPPPAPPLIRAPAFSGGST